MKNILLILLVIVSNEMLAQKKTTFYDSAGNVTTWEGHWSQVVTGRFKTVHNKKENKRILVRTTPEEFESELRKTEKKITKKENLGTPFPDFDVKDLDGNQWAKPQLKGKVLVLNFWFIECPPCELERPALNGLTKVYEGNPDVVFISFAKDDAMKLVNFMKDNPVLYSVISAEKDWLKNNFSVNEYPTNIIVDKNGNYFYNSSAVGIGMLKILQGKIDSALKN